MIQEHIKQHLILVTGLRGSGKTLLAKAISGIFPGTYLCSITDRPIKEYEVDGVDYLFLSRSDMRKAFPIVDGRIYCSDEVDTITTISGIRLSDVVSKDPLSKNLIHTKKYGNIIIPVQSGFNIKDKVNIVSLEADVFLKVTRNLSDIPQTWVVLPTDRMRAQRYMEEEMLHSSEDIFKVFVEKTRQYIVEERIVKSLVHKYRDKKHVEVADLGHLSFEGIKSLVCSIIKRALGRHDG